MNDEANTHYFGMVDQLLEGHLWMQENLPGRDRYKCSCCFMQESWKCAIIDLKMYIRSKIPHASQSAVNLYNKRAYFLLRNLMPCIFIYILWS